MQDDYRSAVPTTVTTTTLRDVRKPAVINLVPDGHVVDGAEARKPLLIVEASYRPATLWRSVELSE